MSKTAGVKAQLNSGSYDLDELGGAYKCDNWDMGHSIWVTRAFEFFSLLVSLYRPTFAL